MSSLWTLIWPLTNHVTPFFWLTPSKAAGLGDGGVKRLESGQQWTEPTTDRSNCWTKDATGSTAGKQRLMGVRREEGGISLCIVSKWDEDLMLLWLRMFLKLLNNFTNLTPKQRITNNVAAVCVSSHSGIYEGFIRQLRKVMWLHENTVCWQCNTLTIEA